MASYLRELASGSPLELLSDLVVTDDDMGGFLDSMALLLRTRRSVVSTDSWPTLEYETPKDVLKNFSYFQNRATFKRFRSVAPFPFRGEPTSGEIALANAAFSRGWDDPRALPRLARLWSERPELSDAASQWLYDELTGEDAFGSDFPSDPVIELRSELDALSRLVRSAQTKTACEPIPRFVSRVENVPLHVLGFSGQSLDGRSLLMPSTAVSTPSSTRDGGCAPWADRCFWTSRSRRQPPSTKSISSLDPWTVASSARES